MGIVADTFKNYFPRYLRRGKGEDYARSIGLHLDGALDVIKDAFKSRWVGRAPSDNLQNIANERNTTQITVGGIEYEGRKSLYTDTKHRWIAERRFVWFPFPWPSPTIDQDARIIGTANRYYLIDLRIKTISMSLKFTGTPAGQGLAYRIDGGPFSKFVFPAPSEFVALGHTGLLICPGDASAWGTDTYTLETYHDVPLGEDSLHETTWAGTGAPPAALEIRGHPLFPIDLAIVITGSGVGPSARWQYSLDDGLSWSDSILGVSYYRIYGTGLSVQLGAGSYVAGNTYRKSWHYQKNFRSRLARSWESFRFAGTYWPLASALRHLNFTRYTISEVPEANELWVRILRPHNYSSVPRWSTVADPGDVWGDGMVWGMPGNLTWNALLQLRRILAPLIPATCHAFLQIEDIASGFWGDGGAWGDGGVWGAVASQCRINDRTY